MKFSKLFLRLPRSAAPKYHREKRLLPLRKIGSDGLADLFLRSEHTKQIVRDLVRYSSRNRETRYRFKVRGTRVGENHAEMKRCLDAVAGGF